MNDPYDGKPWDFTDKSKRERAEELVKRCKPWILIGCPPCTDFSQMQRLNRRNWTEWEKERKMTAARVHLEFAARLYKIQMDEGRLFIHEHPAFADSWKEGCWSELMSRAGVMLVRGDMCEFKMQVKDSKADEYAKKPTKFLTNSLR